MTNIIAVVISFFMLTGNAFATPDHAIMRDLTIETMLRYAKELYQRGDFQESKNVMARIKQLNRDFDLKPKIEKKFVVLPKATVTIPVKAQVEPIAIVAVAPDPNADLIAAIAKEDQILADLNRDVDSLRSQIQATRHE